MTYRLSLLLLFVLPFQFVLPFFGGWDIPIARLLAALILLSFSAEALWRRSLLLPHPIHAGLILSFLGIATLSGLWSRAPELAWPKIVFLLNLMPLVFVWFDTAKRQPAGFVQLIRALVLGAAGAAIVGMGIFLTQFIAGVSAVFHALVDRILPFFLGRELAQTVANYPSLLVNIDGETVLRVTAFFPDPHVAAYFFGLTGFLAFGLAQWTNRRQYYWIGAILFLADLLTFSRGGYLGLVAGALVYGASRVSLLGQKERVRLMTFGIIGLLVLVSVGQPILSRFWTSFTFSDTSSTERLALWTGAATAIGERPVFGVGLGNYLSITRPLASPDTPFYAHNLFLDVAVELGLIGLGLFIGSIGLAFARAIRARQSDPWAIVVLAALTLYLVHSLFETALFSLHVMVLFTLLIAYQETRKEAIAC